MIQRHLMRFIVALCAWQIAAVAAEPLAVDFGYAPPEWQTAICLPDDPQKTLVDRSGELLYHYGMGGREFATRIGVQMCANATWNKQQLLSPRVPIVRTYRTAEGLEVMEEAFALLNDKALARMSDAKPGGPARNDMILVHVTNTSKETRQWEPNLVVDTTLPFRFDTNKVVVDSREVVTSSLKMTGTVREDKFRREIALEPVSVEAGKTAEFYVLHCGGGSIISQPSSLQGAQVARERAEKYWQTGPMPFGRVQVPDPGIQSLFDSSIRNIWQAREIKNGLPVFQVGPTCYRGLWIVDGAFLLESAALVGAGKDARSGITYTLSQQKPSGAFEVLSPTYFKENGIVLWTCVRHAMLTQDKAWLESVWPKLEKACSYIVELRRRSLENDTPLDDGINPPGNIDGGLWGEVKGVRSPEFSNVHWNLTGMRAFVQAAHWLGKEDSAARWQKEYDDFYATFRKAAERDTCKDPHGNAYVPIMMANAGNELPQRAQWTFCHAVYPGQIFDQKDPLVASTMAMLEATEREGMVYGTGWDATGIWNYFASFYGHAWLWQGNGQKAAQILYAYANHASPTCVWREEQSLKGEKFKKVGDMPHNWASAEFIRLTVHLLALDRGDELHLLEGFPKQWAGPGMVTSLDGIATPFGPLVMSAAADAAGKTMTVEFKPLEANCKGVVVHLPDGTTCRMDAQKAGSREFDLK